VSREGAARVYSAQVAESAVQQAIDAHLAHLSQSVRLPGFRAGNIPRAVLLERYGSQARHAALKQLAARIVERELPVGSVAGACELISGQDSGAMEVRIFTTYLPDLPDPDFSAAPFERLTAANPTPAEAAFLRNSLKQQILDRLDTAYPLPLFAGITDREFSALWKAAESQSAIPAGAEDRAAFEERLRAIAARRVRLGVVVSEFARRYGIHAATGPELEDGAIDRLIATATVTERALPADELQQLMRAVEP
jgi:FKBP-type peptidyl-prolyl cis-trans isomerase (trigger factor)